jgi:HAD superfamily hydrolase (TIGR01509 family)
MSETTGVAVVFDMDGVLVDSAPAHRESWRLLAVELGVTLPEDRFGVGFGRHNRDLVPLFFGRMPDERVFVLSERKEVLYRDLIRGAPPVVDGAARLIRGLRQATVRLGIGSSGPLANIRLVVEALGVADCIDGIVSAEDVTRGKPDPEVFTLSCDRLGVPRNRTVVVEDAPAGVEAARAAGAKVIAVLMHHPASAFVEADLVVDRLADLTVERCVALARGNGRQ